VVSEIRTEDGLLVTEFPKVALNVVGDLSASTVRSLRNDLQRVVNDPRGTAHSAFVDFGDDVDLVGGKTGTAEIIKRQTDEAGNVTQEPVTTALFVGVAPINDPQYVVVVIIERGGSGGGIAAPTAKPVLQYLLDQPITEVKPALVAD
jgi:penicillin-binding protein 2